MSTRPDENKKLVNEETRGIPQDTSLSKFIYNKEEGTVLGRNAKSWFNIILFYIIFYILLACFFIGCLTIFLKTLDPKVPRFYGKGTIIGTNPGVAYQPWLKENPDSTLIKFNLRDPSSWNPYVKQLNSYLSKFNNSESNRKCGSSDSNEILETDADALPCRYDLNIFESNGCGPKSEFGFKNGSPCVIISVNRLIGWKPVSYDGNSVPKEIAGRYKQGSIAINCQGANIYDKEHIGKIKYIPEYGIDGRYYPYTFVPGYQQPIAMVKFKSLPRNKLVIVECRAYSLNIEHDITSKLGMVFFEVFVEDKPVVKSEL